MGQEINTCKPMWKKKKKLTQIDGDIFCFKVWKLQKGENDNS